MAANLLRFTPLPSPLSIAATSNHRRLLISPGTLSSFPSPQLSNLSTALPLLRPSAHSPSYSSGSGSGSSGGGSNGWGGGGSDHGHGNNGGSHGRESIFPFLGFLVSGWRSRVAADPQFPFKVLMEELVGVSACVLGDMASRPNFGLNELDFVFSTLVVGSILNFVLMYLLAPTAAASSTVLPGIFSRCPPGHMFEFGSYSLFDRVGTFVYKGALFAAVGFFAGLAGTAISNSLIALRKKMDPEFETPNKPPPTVLNAVTWAIHMGVSSNFRYQTLNGIEFLLARAASPGLFKASVVVLRCLNNVLGGVSFVMLARLTGSQKMAKALDDGDGLVDEKEKLIAAGDEPLPNPSLVEAVGRDFLSSGSKGINSNN